MMHLNSSSAPVSGPPNSGSRCSACSAIQTTNDTLNTSNDSDTSTYTSMDAPMTRQNDNNTATTNNISGQECATIHTTQHVESPPSHGTKQSSGNKLSLTSIGLNLRRAKSFNFKSKRSSATTNKKQAMNGNSATGSAQASSGGGLGPIVSSLSPKWSLRFSCTARREHKQQQQQLQLQEKGRDQPYKVQQQQQQAALLGNNVPSEGCCRCVCYKPFGPGSDQHLSATSNTQAQRDVSTLNTLPTLAIFNQNSSSFTTATSCLDKSIGGAGDGDDTSSRLCAVAVAAAAGDVTGTGTGTAVGISPSSYTLSINRQQSTLASSIITASTAAASSTGMSLDDTNEQVIGYRGVTSNSNSNNCVSGGGGNSNSSSSSVVQLVSNAIVILEEERERNRTMAAMAMAAMNGVVTGGGGGGGGIGAGIYGSNSGAGAEVWEPLFHIPCMSNSVGQMGGQQQVLVGQQHEDCDESARRQRAREIEQGVDPPANYRSPITVTAAGATLLTAAGGAGAGTGGGTRRVQLLCGDTNPNSTSSVSVGGVGLGLGRGRALDQPSTVSATSESTTRRLQIVCPSDLPVDSLRALFQDHVTLRTCPLDSSWTGCHTQVDFVHCLVPDLLSISRCTFYWGKMDRYEAERLLDGKPEGTFLLRDSAQEEFLFSVSFRKYGRSLHARIEQWNHKFSFDSHDPGVYTSDTVCGLIEHYKDPSSCMFFEPVLTWPLHRNFTFSLQHLSRAVITSHLHYDDVNQLQLPKALKSYLKEYHYRQKVRVERFDDCGPNDCIGGGGIGGATGATVSQAVQWLVNTNGNAGNFL